LGNCLGLYQRTRNILETTKCNHEVTKTRRAHEEYIRQGLFEVSRLRNENSTRGHGGQEEKSCWYQDSTSASSAASAVIPGPLVHGETGKGARRPADLESGAGRVDSQPLSAAVQHPGAKRISRLPSS